eukprot:CAMPEP_0116133616 /NCGR_PEP_ID=MMETSP0329-20121206/10203_1 /TAXON_ID=697910 /ORGANISM="Pseudo-nitzschia arenysensis, Strain B593" /LENGTH=212 /DNA_ID=CAMNT_0003628263 /DNA_START=15 /DNA_END=654 /DNA_ORIENTATION=+
MTIATRTPFAAAALALFSFQSINLFVDGAISIQTEVQCLLEEPDICIGEQTELGPTPAIECVDLDDPTSCRTTYVGGYTYQYVFVEGLKEGTTDVGEIEKAKTGSKITVYIEDDSDVCEVAIGTRSCNMCSTEGCPTISGFAKSVKYDAPISFDECVPLEPFLYPFYFAGGTTSAIISDQMEFQARTKERVSLGFIALGMFSFVFFVGLFAN